VMVVSSVGRGAGDLAGKPVTGALVWMWADGLALAISVPCQCGQRVGAGVSGASVGPGVGAN
jgi:hypothetical protein